MDYGLVGKIEKAKAYAEQRDRIHFESFTVVINGDNSSHRVTYNDGSWHCDCDFFEHRSQCSHTMAMERVLEQMIDLP